MTILPQKLENISTEFEDMICQNIQKVAYIRHRGNKWWVLSEKGKSLGKYDTKDEAVKRLRQVEYFKYHRKKSKKKASDETTYSSMVRQLNKDNNQSDLDTFQKVFKEEFDKAYLNGDEEPEQIAFEAAKKSITIASYNDLLFKAASAIEMGDPEYAGKYLSEVIKFLLRRISPEKQTKAIDTMKKKVWFINEYDISSKKIPAGAAYGQAITLLKHILMENSPGYIRSVLNSIVRHL